MTNTTHSDYNYEIGPQGDCFLVPGLQPFDHAQYCKENPSAIEYYDPTGYRKIPLSTCHGGKEFDKQSDAHTCPGKDEEFKQRHGISGVGLFFAITLPFAFAGAVGWWVYRNWGTNFGQIRLGETASNHGFGDGAFSSDSPFVRYPIIAVSAIVAVASAIPLVVSGLWRAGVSAVDRYRYGSGGGFSSLGGAGPFTTRDSFARGRGDYEHVDDDEGELLGDDSDEEV